jgi:glutaconate CoA-transferase subunit A
MSALTTIDAVVGELRDGMTIGIGGWGSRRKPMALIRAIAASDLKDLTLVSYGGPDVGILCALNKVRKLVFGFVSLDSIALEPHFRAARQQGRLPEVMELDEGLVLQGLRAAAWNLPYLPSRAGLGSAVQHTNPDLQTVTCPYTGDSLLAMPALKLDVALLHLNRADAAGNCQYLGPDPYMDRWYAMAAERCFVTVEKLGLEDGPSQSLLLSSMHVDGVVESPGGAWFTQCLPDYPRDEATQKRYASTAKDPEAWAAFADEFWGGAA